ncbi:protein LIAT1 [Hippocampus zosterae]|uniref:protein LIAT1 n=1 Tax=Hippocampus zosterae TaxID=109293 RepID=UPI00223D8E12|nr:protein LIAT1 [Hippocampus zosterae]
MSEEDGRKMKTSSSSDDKKKKRRKKRKRRKKLGAALTPQQAALAELNPAVKGPEPARATPVPRGRTSKRRTACKKSKEPPREPLPLPLASDGPLKEPRPAGARVPPPTPSPPHVQLRECLRWEGALQDPRAEEERLETYRANRRRRYAAQRDAPPEAPLARIPAAPPGRRAL